MTRFDLGADQIPTAWYNVAARSRPSRCSRRCTRAPRSRSVPTTSRRCSRWASSRRRCRPTPWIDIPGEVLDILRLWRPTPLVRAERLEAYLGTPARIYFKDESVSPAGSHKPNTAVPQAFYNKAEGIDPARDRDRRRPVGDRAVVRVPPVRPRLQGVHGAVVATSRSRTAGSLMETWGSERRPVTGRRPVQPRLARARDQRRGARRRRPRRHALLARLGAQPRAPAPDRDRPRGEGAARAGGRDAARRGDRRAAAAGRTSAASRCRS